MQQKIAALCSIWSTQSRWYQDTLRGVNLNVYKYCAVYSLTNTSLNLIHNGPGKRGGFV